MRSIKTNIISGLIFLIPIGVLVIILAKIFSMMAVVAKPLDALIPTTSIGGITTANIIAVLGVLIVCYVFGFVAKSIVGKKIFQVAEGGLMAAIPGYAFVKSFSDSMATSKKVSEGFKPIVANFDDNAQIAFEVERTPTGNVVIYLPGAPNPWSGSVIYMEEKRVQPLDMTFSEALKNIRQLGRGSAAYKNLIHQMSSQ